MTTTFESEKNKKALLYTAIICIVLLIVFFLIRWTSVPPNESIVKDLIEINLGNNSEGWGEEQPLVRGKKTNELPQPNIKNISGAPTENTKVATDNNYDKDAATVDNSPIKTNQKPKLTYTGPDKGKNGNNDADNGYTYQGTKKNGTGDNGDPNGDKDSYGDTPGGNKGGPKVIRGNRKIMTNYKFEGNLNRATIYANIKVSPSGIGSFVGFDKGSTERSKAYANAINQYLQNIQFNSAPQESMVTVQFIFDVN
jgi:hypothetical protein